MNVFHAIARVAKAVAAAATAAAAVLVGTAAEAGDWASLMTLSPIQWFALVGAVAGAGVTVYEIPNRPPLVVHE